MGKALKESTAPSLGKFFSATALLPGAIWGWGGGGGRRTKESTKTPKSLILSLLGCSEIWGSPRYDHLFDDIHHTYSGNKIKPYKLKTDLLCICKLCCNAQVRMKSMFSQWVEKRQITTMLKVWWFGVFFTHSIVYNEDGKNPRNWGRQGRASEDHQPVVLSLLIKIVSQA